MIDTTRSAPLETTQIHATCIAIDGAGILLRGASGSGKSDLALRLMDRGAGLVADDQVILTNKDNRIWANPPDTIQGKLEIRGIGIVTVKNLANIPVTLVIDLVARNEVDRMPDPQKTRLCGHVLPVWRLHAFDLSTVIKIETLLRQN